MSRKKKPQRAARKFPAPPVVRLDPNTGLPPVGRGLADEAARIVGRARTKHAHKQHPPR